MLMLRRLAASCMEIGVKSCSSGVDYLHEIQWMNVRYADDMLETYPLRESG